MFLLGSLTITQQMLEVKTQMKYFMVLVLMYQMHLLLLDLAF